MENKGQRKSRKTGSLVSSPSDVKKRKKVKKSSSKFEKAKNSSFIEKQKSKEIQKTSKSNKNKSSHNSKKLTSKSNSDLPITKNNEIDQNKNSKKTPKKRIKTKSRKSAFKQKSRSQISSSYTDNKPVLKKESSKLAQNKEDGSLVKNYTGLVQKPTPSVIQRKKKKYTVSDYKINSSAYMKAKNNNSLYKSPEIQKVHKIKSPKIDSSYSK